MQAFPHHYHVSAAGGASGSVVVSGQGLPDMDTQPPPAFGGPEGVWSPETLLSAAVADCLILTFRAIAGASKFEWNSLQCSVEGVLDRPERTTFFTAFNIAATLQVPAGANTEMAQRLLEKSEQNCLVTNSLKAEITLQTEVLVN